MQCTMLPKVDYLNTQELIARQREAVLDKIREMSKSHIVYPGLPQFQVSNEFFKPVTPQDVPGLSQRSF
jgi:histone acetyltransferase